MRQLKIIFLVINGSIVFLHAQTDRSSQINKGSGLVISVIPYTLASYDIAQLSDTITAKMSYLYNHWIQQENPYSPNAQVFRIFVPNPDSIVLTVKDSKGNFINEPFNKYITRGYYSVKVDNYHFPQSGIFFLTAKFCDSTFTRKMIFIK